MRRILATCFGGLLWALTFARLVAFPTIAATATSIDTTTNTTQVISLPAGISSGDLLLLAFYGSGTDASLHTTATGWTLLGESVVTNSVAHLSVFYRIADGGEGASVSFTTDVSEDSAGCVYRIAGQHAVTTPQINAGPPVGSSTSPDPELLTPTWSTEDTLFIAIGGADGSAVDFTAYPTNYDTSQITIPTHTANGGACAMAARAYTADSDDPGVFTIDTSVRWITYTVAVRNFENPKPLPRRIL